MIFHTMTTIPVPAPRKHYHIRLTANIGCHRYAQYLVERTVSHLMVTENSDEDCKQTHHHCHFTSIQKNDQALRREYKKWFPLLSGNKDYSLKEGNEVGFNYVAKGSGPDWETQKPHVVSTTFSDEEVKEFHRQYWNHHDRTIMPVAVGQAIINEAHDHATYLALKKERKKRPTWTQEVINEIRTAHPDHGYDYNHHEDRKYLVDKILLRMGEGGKALDETVFRRIFFAVYNGLKKTSKAHGEFRQKFYQCLDK